MTVNIKPPKLKANVGNPVAREIVVEPIDIDNELSYESENPVQNKVIAIALDDKADASDIPTRVSQLQNDSGYLTSAPVTSVNGQTGAVSIPVPSTAADVGAVSVAQGAAKANQFLVTDSSGNVTTKTLESWQAQSY